MQEEQDDPAEKTWSQLFYEFTQNTTYHGMRYITESTPWIIRRIIWILIVCAATTAFIYIVVTSFIKFADFKTNVNVQIVYQDRVAFPDVTICNQNFVRATRTYKEQMYDIIAGNFSLLTKQEVELTDTSDCSDSAEDHTLYSGYGLADLSGPSTATYQFAAITFAVCRYLCENWAEVQIEIGSFSCIGVEFQSNSGQCTVMEKSAHDKDGVMLKLQEGYEHRIMMVKRPCSVPGVNVTYMPPLPAQPEKDDNHTLFGSEKWQNDLYGFVDKSGHQKERMIHSCKWQGKNCKSSDFRRVMTDYGLCFTFKPDGKNSLNIKSTGSTFGLKLVINVEQYDYMPGLHSDTGIKVYLHPSEELAMVRDMGFAVPPGRHSLIGVKQTQLSNMGGLYGDCGSQELDHYKQDNYTWFRCQRNCETKTVVETCHCRNIYMNADSNGNPGICNISQYFSCIIHKMGKDPSLLTKNDCSCTQPCNRIIYEPVVSNAALSSLSIDEILSRNREELYARKTEASDTQNRVNEKHFFEVVDILIGAKSALQLFITGIDQQVTQFQDKYMNPIISSFKGLVQVFEDDMNDRFFYQLNEVIRDLDTIFGPGRSTVYFTIDRVIRNTMLVLMHIRNLIAEGYAFSRIDELLEKGVEYCEAVIFTLPKYNSMVHNVSHSLGSFGFTPDDFPFLPMLLSQKTPECDNRITEFINMTHGVLDDIVELQDKMNKHKNNESNIGFNLKFKMIRIKEYEVRFGEMAKICLDPYFILVGEIHDFNTSFLSDLETHVELNYNFDIEGETAEFRMVQKEMEEYVHGYLTEYKILKYQLQTELTETFLNQIISIERTLTSKVQIRLSERLRRRMDKAKNDIHTWYKKLFEFAAQLKEYMAPDWGLRRIFERAKSLAIWRAPVAVVDPEEQAACNCTFNFKSSTTTEGWTNADFFGENSTQALNLIVESFFHPINQALNDFDDILNENEALVSSSMKDVRNLMSQYRDNDATNRQFIENNFLQMDVFFSELQELKIEEYPAFPLTDLLGNVGGFMGLLLGMSAITVFELIDLILYNCLRKMTKGTKKIVVTGENGQDSVKQGGATNL